MADYGYCTTHECREYILVNLGYFRFYRDLSIVNKEMSYLNALGGACVLKKLYEELRFVEKVRMENIGL